MSLYNNTKEYVNMTLPDGTTARFRRDWAQYRFTDDEVEQLMQGAEITINTDKYYGITGALDWQEYLGREYFGFAPNAARAYTIDDAPFPVMWYGHTFTEDERAYLRSGERLPLILTSERTGNDYAVNVTFRYMDDAPYGERWGIYPHFDEFNMHPSEFTKETACFMPRFGDTQLSVEDIRKLRSGQKLKIRAMSKSGHDYEAYLKLTIERGRWRLKPEFK